MDSVISARPTPANYVQFLRSLLDGMSEHAVEGEGQDRARFRGEISSFSDRLSEESSCEEISTVVNSGLRSFADYHGRAAKFWATQAGRADTPPLRDPGSGDPVTGLPGRTAAEGLMAANITAGKDCVSVIFLVNRLGSINGRYGRKVGDEVMLQVAQHLAKRAPSGTRLFRWGGPAFAAIVEVHSNIAELSRDLSRLASLKLEKNIETEHRFVMVPITILYMPKRITANAVAQTVFAEMDQFIAASTGDMVPDSTAVKPN
jgi:GGDEF domain-containing protein